MMVTEAMIRRIYPHRVAADPKVCPVCCGDTHTDDRRFGTEVTHTINDGSPTPRPIYRCLACVVWAETLAPNGEPWGDVAWDDPTREVR